MSLLDNELVKKYFGADKVPPAKAEIYMALGVLEAMEQPIKKGERVLYLHVDRVFEPEGGDWSGRTGFHGHVLRLPDRFQPQPPAKGCEHDWKCRCGAGLILGDRNKAIEEERSLANRWQNRAALAENLISKIKKEVGEQDYGTWGMNLWKLLKQYEDGISAKNVEDGIRESNAGQTKEPAEKHPGVFDYVAMQEKIQEIKNAGKPAEQGKCDHSGLKRYCGDEVYCESCKKGIKKEMDNCILTSPHVGPCKPPLPREVEEKIKYLSRSRPWSGLCPSDYELELRGLVELARKS